MKDVKIVLDQRASESLNKILAGDRIHELTWHDFMKVVMSASSVRMDNDVLTLSISDARQKRALTERSVAIVKGTNIAEALASVASLGEGLYKFFTGDDSSAMTFIAAGAVGLFDVLKSLVIDAFKE